MIYIKRIGIASPTRVVFSFTTLPLFCEKEIHKNKRYYMNKREKLFHDLFTEYNVDYDLINFHVFAYALRLIIKYSKEEEDGQYYFNFHITDNDTVLNNRKRVNNQQRHYRAIIIEELIRSGMVKKVKSAMYGRNYTTQGDNIPMCELFRLNSSVYYKYLSLKEKDKLNIMGLTKDFEFEQDDIFKKKIENMKKEMEISFDEKVEVLKTNLKENISFDLTTSVKTELLKTPYHVTRIAEWKAGNINCTISEKTGRYTHTFATLPRKVRSITQMKMKGRYFPLKCIDLKSSQPLLLTTLINDPQYSNIVKNEDIYDYLISKLEETTYIFGEGKRKRERTLDQVILMEKRQFKIYCGFDGYKDPRTRDGMKAQFMRFVASNRKLPLIDNIICQHLPNFYEQVQTLKTRLNANNYITDNEGNYITEEKLISCKNGKEYTKNVKIYKDKKEKVFITTLLQKIESDIFIKTWEEFYDCTIPLHDSIYFPYDASGKKIKNYETKIMKSLQAKFEALGIDGFNLTCKLEDFNDYINPTF